MSTKEEEHLVAKFIPTCTCTQKSIATVDSKKKFTFSLCTMIAVRTSIC